MKSTQIPGKYIADSGADFSEPLSYLLVQLGLLGKQNMNQDDGLNELKEGALGLSKWVGRIAGGAGVAGLVTSIASAFTHAHEPTRVALISGGSAIAAAAAIAVALVVRADVRARATSTVAQYEARSQISSAFLALSGSLLPPPTQTKSNSSSLLFAFVQLPAHLRVRAKNHDTEMGVRGLRRVAGGELQVKLEDGDWIPESDVETFHLERVT